MERRSLEAIFRALNKAEARYLVVGGVAVIAHGYVRNTADLDLVLELEPENLKRALPALAGLGYRPRAPVPILDFADPAKRASWMREKGMLVFSLFSDEHYRTEVDIFVEHPFDFERAYAEAFRQEMAPGLSATIVSRRELIAMKEKCGRPEDLLDVARLRDLRPREPG